MIFGTETLFIYSKFEMLKDNEIMFN